MACMQGTATNDVSGSCTSRMTESEEGMEEQSGIPPMTETEIRRELAKQLMFSDGKTAGKWHEGLQLMFRACDDGDPEALYIIGKIREDSAPVIIRSSIKESLEGRSAGFAIDMDKGSRLGVPFKVRGRIDVINPATIEVVDSVVMEQLRPETAGDPAFVFYLDSIRAFCVVDKNGACFAVGKIGDSKRWTKRIIWNGGTVKR